MSFHTPEEGKMEKKMAPSRKDDTKTIPAADDDVVISGISCRLPESENMEEFRQHLLRGEDMVTETNRRWQQGIVQGICFNRNET